MGFVSRSGGEQRRDVAASGAPPTGWDPDREWNPDDPDTVKVHYDLSGWGFDERGEVAEALAEHQVPHVWQDAELVVPEEVESAVDELLGGLEAELGPFPVPLDADDPATEFGLDEWPDADLAVLKSALIDAEIPHRWDGATVFVATDAEDEVDDLLDAIERGDIASFDLDVESAPPEVLGLLYSIGDRLVRDANEGSARRELFSLTPGLHPRVAPFGIAVRSWERITTAAISLRDAFENSVDPDEVTERAGELRDVTRPFV